MAKKKQKGKRPSGHYCKICGDRKPNERFSGKGHSKHICKECEALPQERKNELRYITQIDRAAWKYPHSRQDWELLEKMAKNKKYPEAMEYAQSILGMNRNQPLPEEEEDSFDEWSEGEEHIDLLPESLSFSDFDEDSQEEIREAIREDVYDFFCYEKPDNVTREKFKLKTLKWIVQNLYFGYDQKLIFNDELNNLFETIFKEVSADLENENFE